MDPTPRRYRGVSAEERRAARRRQLLDAALEIAGTRGVERATMTAICAEAGLTERYFYESFADTDELLGAVYDQVSGQLAAEVEAAMTRRVVTCAPDSKISEIARTMTTNRIRHLPVLEQGKMIGIISIGDLVKAVIDEQQQTIDHLERYIAG